MHFVYKIFNLNQGFEVLNSFKIQCLRFFFYTFFFYQFVILATQ